MLHARCFACLYCYLKQEHLLDNAWHSGVTTMGSDRANPGAPNPNGPNGGPQTQAVEQKHWPGPLICHNVVFWPSEFCKMAHPKSGKWHFRESRFKNFPCEPWIPRKLVHIRCSTRAFGTSTRGGGFENFEPGAPCITLRHWPGNYCFGTFVPKTFCSNYSVIDGGSW
jgi:hypothetical protein